MHVAIIGGGVAGLSAGLGLARNGHRVTILERDPAPGNVELEDAFNSWSRKGVPQIRQGHFVLGRAKDMLDKHAPDVIDTLGAEGIVPASNPMLALLSEDQLQPGDDLTPIPTRRIPFELTLRRVAEAEPAIEIRSGVKVTGLTIENSTALPRVRGLGLDNGTDLGADFVVDAGGNHSRVQNWLREKGAVPPPELSQDCGVTYYGRYFRAKEDTPDPWTLIGSSGQTEYLTYVVFPGDLGTYGVVFFTPSWERELRALRDVDAWNATASRFPSIAPWVTQDFADALTPVAVTAGQNNVIRPLLNDGVPTSLGCVSVGDALCTTDARFAWGLSLALTHGFAAAAAISDHAGDPGDVALAYSQTVMPELEACFQVASTSSRIGIRKWKGEFTGPQGVDEEREELFSVLSHSPDQIFTDAVILRGFFRRLNLADAPNAVFQDAEFVGRLRALAEARGALSAPEFGPTRDELVRLLSSEGASVGRGA